MSRPDWDAYFLSIAAAVATRATCPRKSVGAVVVHGNRIVATGYNGAPKGKPHCIDVGCYLVDGKCSGVTHAEVNAIKQAVHYGIGTQGATIYVTTSPCRACFEMIAQLWITRVVFPEWFYRDRDEIIASAAHHGIELVGPA